MSSTNNKMTKEITLGITMKSTTSFCIRSKFHIFLNSLFKVEGLKGKGIKHAKWIPRNPSNVQDIVSRTNIL
jgi:hypothetical protein